MRKVTIKQGGLLGKSKHYLLIVFSFAYTIFAFLTYKLWPIANGEEFRYLRGKETLAHFLHGEFTELLIQPLPHYFLYNAYPAVLNLLNPNFYLEWFHLLNLLFSLLLFIGVYFLAYRLFEDSRWAIFSLIALVLFPTFSGHMAINPIDMPFTAFYVFSLLAIHWASGRERMPPSKVLLLGFLFGVSQGMRQLGLTLYLLLVFMDFLTERNIRSLIRNRLGSYILVFIVANFFMLITWPNFAINYVKSAIWYLAIGQEFHLWDYGLLFGGKFLTNAERPLYYLPLLQVLTTPIYILGSLALVPLYIKKAIKNRSFLLLLAAFLVNYALYFILNPVLYDGTRHFLHLIPIFTLLGLFGLYTFFKTSSNTRVKLFVVLFALTNLVYVGYKSVKTFPNHYVYFNELAGIFVDPYYNFEYDYSSLSYKEASEWVRDVYVPRVGSKTVTVYACDNGFAVDYYSQRKFDVILEREEADLIICDYRVLARNKGNLKYHGEVIYSVSFDSHPINFVILPQEIK